MSRARTTVKVRDLKRPECVLHVRGTKNNFRLTLCDLAGNVLKQDTAGVTFKGSKKSTPHAANVVSDRMARWSLERGVQGIHAKINGVGVGPEMALRTMHNRGLGVLSIRNVTGIPHGGCKPRKKPRK